MATLLDSLTSLVTPATGQIADKNWDPLVSFRRRAGNDIDFRAGHFPEIQREIVDRFLQEFVISLTGLLLMVLPVC